MARVHVASLIGRRVLSGIVHALQIGGRWGDCPEPGYGPKKTLHNRFVRCAERSIWEGIFSALAGCRWRNGPAVHRQQLHQGTPDSRRRKRGAWANGIGQTRSGRNSKVHAICDAY